MLTQIRKSEFREDIPIKLGDGQTWHVPRPVVEFGFQFDDSGKPSVRRKSLGYGDGYMALVDRFDGSTELGERLVILAEMVARLLRLNYELSPEDLTALLPYRPSDPSNQSMWSELVDVATGAYSPKDEPEVDG